MRRTRRLGCCHCSDELRVSLDRTRTPVLRRQILVVLGAASLTPLQWASAQTRSGPARLGILSPSAASTEAKWRTVLTARLHELGHEPGRNLVIEERYAEGTTSASLRWRQWGRRTSTCSGCCESGRRRRAESHGHDSHRDGASCRSGHSANIKAAPLRRARIHRLRPHSRHSGRRSPMH